MDYFMPFDYRDSFAILGNGYYYSPTVYFTIFPDPNVVGYQVPICCFIFHCVVHCSHSPAVFLCRVSLSGLLSTSMRTKDFWAFSL